MARKSRHSILKRQRELRKQEKQEAKRLKKLAKAEGELAEGELAEGEEAEGENAEGEDGQVAVELAPEGETPEPTTEPIIRPMEATRPQPVRREEV